MNSGQIPPVPLNVLAINLKSADIQAPVTPIKFSASDSSFAIQFQLELDWCYNRVQCNRVGFDTVCANNTSFPIVKKADSCGDMACWEVNEFDAANLVGEERTLVDLTASGGEYKKGIFGMIISYVAWLVLVIQGLGFHFGWYETGVSGPLPFDRVTLLMILMAVLALMMWAQGRIIEAAREVTSPGAYGVIAGGS